MDKNYETRHIFMTLGILTLIFAPIFLLFVPHTVSNIVHYTKGMWDVFVPGVNFLVYAIGFFLLFLSSMILFLLDIRKASISISVIFLCLSFAFFFFAAQSHISLGDHRISFSPIFSMKNYEYSWEEVEKIIRKDPENRGYYDYEFVFNDGNKMVLSYNGYVREILSRLSDKTKEMNIIVETDSQ